MSLTLKPADRSRSSLHSLVCLLSNLNRTIACGSLRVTPVDPPSPELLAVCLAQKAALATHHRLTKGFAVSVLRHRLLRIATLSLAAICLTAAIVDSFCCLLSAVCLSAGLLLLSFMPFTTSYSSDRGLQLLIKRLPDCSTSFFWSATPPHCHCFDQSNAQYHRMPSCRPTDEMKPADIIAPIRGIKGKIHHDLSTPSLLFPIAEKIS